MTINVQLVTVLDSISNLSIPGVTVKDIDDIPANAIDFCPVLFPEPIDFISELTYTRASFGSDDTAKMDVEYTLKYTYLHAPLGSGSLLANYIGLADKIEEILEAFLGNSSPTGAIDLTVQSVTTSGMRDPVGNPYHGAQFTVRVKEFAQ